MNDFINRFLESQESRRKILVSVALVAGVSLTGAFISADKLQSSLVGIDSSTYQAIHLDTDQTYFGKVTEASDDSLTIKDVFYFLDDSNKKLVKKTDDLLTLNRQHVLTTENLDAENPVTKAILKYFKNKK